MSAPEFKPAWWLRNRHAQTIFPSFPWVFRQRIRLRREALDLPDGDVTAVDWTIDTQPSGPDQPLLVILHGLESSAQSTYAQLMIAAAIEKGWQCCVLHFRDCGDYSNRLPRRYHAGETSDIRYFLNLRTDANPRQPIFLVGYSLGGNVLLKYLGESGQDTPARSAAAICVPLDLGICSDALNTGFSKVYQRYMINKMKNAVRRKFGPETSAFDWHRAMDAATFAEFDDAVTAPLHGFDGMQDYYARCSSKGFLAGIRVPTLLLNALDDPFMSSSMYDRLESISESVRLELSAYGGHVGFIDGGTPWRPHFYLPERVRRFLELAIAD